MSQELRDVVGRDLVVRVLRILSVEAAEIAAGLPKDTTAHTRVVMLMNSLRNLAVRIEKNGLR